MAASMVYQLGASIPGPRDRHGPTSRSCCPTCEGRPGEAFCRTVNLDDYRAMNDRQTPTLLVTP